MADTPKKLFTNEAFAENSGFKEAVETIAGGGTGGTGSSTDTADISTLKTQVADLSQRVADLEAAATA